MNRDDVIRMAQEAEIDCDTEGDIWGSTNGALLRFASLVAAAEREACAKEADKWSKRKDDVGAFIGKAIRARGRA